MKNHHLLVLIVVVSGLTACSERREHVRSVEEFMEQPALLHGVVLQCNSHKDHSRHDHECINAWAAVERLGQADDAQQAPKREQQFERNRDKVRVATEQHIAADREKPFDPYRAPVATEVIPDPTTARP